MYQKQTGVQKINTVFLTDGAGCSLDKVYHINTNDKGETFNSSTYGHCYRNNFIMTDSITNTSVSSADCNKDTTQMLLELLKKRVPEMNIVNFFVAGTGRNGKICKYAVRDLIRSKGEDWYETDIKARKVLKEISKENVGIFDNKNGFDQVYLLPGLNNMISDESLNVQVGASKAQLTRAFGKMATGKLSNRPLLNNFVKMVA